MNAPLDIQVAHVLQRRIRVVIPALKGDQERFYLLEILLRKRPAIREIRSEMPDRLTDHPFRPGGHHAHRPARRRDADRHRAGAQPTAQGSNRKRKAVPEGPLLAQFGSDRGNDLRLLRGADRTDAAARSARQERRCQISPQPPAPWTASSIAMRFSRWSIASATRRARWIRSPSAASWSNARRFCAKRRASASSPPPR